MTEKEAFKSLGLAPGVKRREIDTAFNRLRLEYVSKAQHSTLPGERDVAYRVLGIVQDAHRELTGSAAPTPGNAHRGTTKPQSATIPRASMGGATTRRSASARRASATAGTAKSATPARRSQVAAMRWWPPTVEGATASAICAAMFLVALFILTQAWGCRHYRVLPRPLLGASAETFLPLFSGDQAHALVRHGREIVSETARNNQPIATKQFDRVQAAIWRQAVETANEENAFHTFTISRSFKDANDEWRRSHSFTSRDLPHIGLAVEWAMRELLLKEE